LQLVQNNHSMTEQVKWSNLIPLGEDTIQQMADNIPGIYRLSYLSQNSSGETSYYVFYVGKSENSIKKRLQDHINNINSNGCIKNHISANKCYFRYARIDKGDIRSSAELQAYKHYTPSCNEVVPEGDENITVNMN